MSSAAPKAIKAFVSEVVKAKLLESNNAFQDKPEIPIMGLLKMELVQRGVLVASNDDDIEKWDLTKTIETVRSSIGKPMLEEGSLPTPLLAASALMAGRTAELCAELCSKSPTPLSIDVQSALLRCKEVQDLRFQVLLELFKRIDDGDWNSAKQATCLQLVAEGCYFRATQFQPDTPQVWKKACDVILLRHNQQEGGIVPGDAANCFENMARIASSKGNTKRATELSLRAAEGYLELANESNKPTDSSAVEGRVTEAFLGSYKILVKNPLEKANESLQFCCNNLQLLSPEDGFVLKLLKVQLELSKENLSIEEETRSRKDQAQRRAKTVNTKEIREQARCDVLAKSDPKSLQGDTAALRDAFLSKEGTPEIRARAAKTLMDVVERNRERIPLIARLNPPASDGWSALRLYILPFLDYYRNGGTKEEIAAFINNLPDEEVTLAESCLITVPYILWLNLSSREDIPDDTVSLVTQVLGVLKEKAQKAKDEYQASSNVLKSSTQPMDVKIAQLTCAHASMQAWWILSQEHNQTGPRKKHSELALSMAQQEEKFEAFSVPYGTSFLNFLVAWGGLCRPWNFSTVSEARLIWKSAENCLSKAASNLGRPSSPVERLALLDLAKADMEGGILSGGFASEASKLYAEIRNQASALSNVNSTLQKIITSKCLAGLARLKLGGADVDESSIDPITLAKDSLGALMPISVPEGQWMPAAVFSLPASPCFSYQVSVSRQLIADALIRNGRSQEAKVFLEDAVRESPLDPDVAFSLGAFLLRESRSTSSEKRSQLETNEAKTQLLKAAKLDARKAGPFALLGVLYEDQNDAKRALGCYSKALLLDPPNPVAGRGFLRLTHLEASKSILDAAIQSSSPLNGWAWRAVGRQKVMISGENSLGTIALLKALRSKDISEPQNEPLAPFFAPIRSTTKMYIQEEKAETWSELAFAYRLLGRYTAAIRSYRSSFEAAGDQVTADVLCACAEAELGLGLAEDAAEKYGRALELSDTARKPMAAYGRARALLSLAQRDAEDGKFGAAKRSIEIAVEGFEASTNNFSCAQKLLGDIFSFGALLPLSTFEDTATGSALDNQLSFVSKGKAAYKLAAECVGSVLESMDESRLLQAALVTDAGANLLLCAQLEALQSSSTSDDDSQNFKSYDEAKAEFSQALQLYPEYAPAWCGLGLSAIHRDPLLAQHALCRSLQLDALSPDPYVNLAFLYTSHKSSSASEAVLDELTQVADSPMMWINRAIICEQNAGAKILSGDTKAEEELSKAADAYRAALQLVKHPHALLSLALTCRRGSGSVTALQESHGLLQQYNGKMASLDASASLFEGLVDLETKANASIDRNGTLCEEGKELVGELSKKLGSCQQRSSDSKMDGLDVALIQKCLESAKVCVWEEEKDMPSIVPGSASRQIINEPARGDLWLKLSKSLLLERGQSKAGLASALVASDRAVYILTDQLTFPSKQQGGNSRQKAIVNSTDLSEALSHSCWLGQLNAQNSGGPPSKLSQLQKALMMDPGNRFARAALAQFHHE